eukprot:1574458-Ditylum_brightwellii.AAC.1
MSSTKASQRKTHSRELFFCAINKIIELLTRAVDQLMLPSGQTFCIFYNVNKDGVIPVGPGLFDSPNPDNVKELIKVCNISQEKLNDHVIRMYTVGFFITQGNVVTEHHTDPGSGYPVMLGGGTTRVIFPEEK